MLHYKNNFIRGDVIAYQMQKYRCKNTCREVLMDSGGHFVNILEKPYCRRNLEFPKKSNNGETSPWFFLKIFHLSKFCRN